MLANGSPGWCETGLLLFPSPVDAIPIRPVPNPATSPKKAPSTPTCPVCCTSPLGPEIMSRLILRREPREPRRELRWNLEHGIRTWIHYFCQSSGKCKSRISPHFAVRYEAANKIKEIIPYLKAQRRDQ